MSYFSIDPVTNKMVPTGVTESTQKSTQPETQKQPDFEGAMGELDRIREQDSRLSTPTPEEWQERIKTSPTQSWGDVFKAGFAQPVVATGTTVKLAGNVSDQGWLSDIGKTMEGAKNWYDPYYVSPSAKFQKGNGLFGFDWYQAPKAIAEQSGQLVGSIASRYLGAAAMGVTGAAVGTVAPGAGNVIGGAGGLAAGAMAGPFLFEAMQIAGPSAYARAQNNGRTEPNREDIEAALATAAVSGSLNALGAKYLPGGEKAIGGFLKKLGLSAMNEGLTEAGQSVAQQAGETAGTKKGLTIDWRKAATECILAAGSAHAATTIHETSAFLKDKALRQKNEAESTEAQTSAEARAVEKLKIIEEAKKNAKPSAPSTYDKLMADAQSKEDAAASMEQVPGTSASRAAYQRQAELLRAQAAQAQQSEKKPSAADRLLEMEGQETPTEPAEITPEEKATLTKVAKNETLTQEELKPMEQKGLVKEVEGETVISEPARLAMGEDAPPLSEKDFLTQIRDKFSIPEGDLKELTDATLGGIIRETKAYLADAPKDLQDKVASSMLEPARKELARRATTPLRDDAPFSMLNRDRLQALEPDIVKAAQVTMDASTSALNSPLIQDGTLNLEYYDADTDTSARIFDVDPKSGKLRGMVPGSPDPIDIPIRSITEGNATLAIVDPKRVQSNKETKPSEKQNLPEGENLPGQSGEVQTGSPEGLLRKEGLQEVATSPTEQAPPTQPQLPARERLGKAVVEGTPLAAEAGKIGFEALNKTISEVGQKPTAAGPELDAWNTQFDKNLESATSKVEQELQQKPATKPTDPTSEKPTTQKTTQEPTPTTQETETPKATTPAPTKRQPKTPTSERISMPTKATSKESTARLSSLKSLREGIPAFLKHVAEFSDNKQAKRLAGWASKLDPKTFDNLNIEVGNFGDTPWAAKYSASKKKITVNLDTTDNLKGGTPTTLVHEMVHHLFREKLSRWRSHPESMNATEKQSLGVLQRTLDVLKQIPDNSKVWDGVSDRDRKNMRANLEELMDEILTNPEAQKVLEKILPQVNDIPVARNETKFQGFLRTLGEFLFGRPTGPTSAYNNAFQASFNLIRPESKRRFSSNYIDSDTTPVIAYVAEQGGITSPARRGKGKRGAEYDGIISPREDGSGPFLKHIMSRDGGLPVDEMAQSAFDEGLIPDAYPDTLWDAMRGEIRTYRKIQEEQVKEDKYVEAITRSYDKVAPTKPVKGQTPKFAGELNAGDQFTSQGSQFEVMRVYPDGRVDVRDLTEKVHLDLDPGTTIQIDEGSYNPAPYEQNEEDPFSPADGELYSFADLQEKLQEVVEAEPNTIPPVEVSQLEGGRVRSIARKMNTILDQQSKIDLDPSNRKFNSNVTKAANRLVEVANSALRVFPKFTGWYSGRIKMMNDILVDLEPSLKDPDNKVVFDVFLANTSDGSEVDTQFQDTYNLYKNWQETGKIDINLIRSDRRGTVYKKLNNFLRMMEKTSPKEMRDFLDTKGTTKSLREVLVNKFEITKDDAAEMTKGELVDEVIPYSLIFGPKLGSFYNNIQGDLDTTTMDRWFMRTFGRTIGNQINKVPTAKVQSAQERFQKSLDSIKKENTSYFEDLPFHKGTTDASKIASAIHKYFTKPQNRTGLTATQEEFRKATNDYFKIADGYSLKEAPDNGTDRRTIRKVMSEVIQKLAEQNINLKPAEAQALLWYYEKQLHEKLGSKQKNAAPDYGTAANELWRGINGSNHPSFKVGDAINPDTRGLRPDRTRDDGQLESGRGLTSDGELYSPAETKARFDELTEGLQRSDVRAGQLQEWRTKNPEKYNELKSLRENVLQSQGDTRKAFHGTKSDYEMYNGDPFPVDSFTVFDDSKSPTGKKPGVPNGVHFFADNKTAAASYGPWVMDVILNLGNKPKVEDMAGAPFSGGHTGEVIATDPITGEKDRYDNIEDATSYLTRKYPDKNPKDFIDETQIWSTNRRVKQAIADGYTSLIIKNVVDYGGDVGTRKPFDVTVVFNSNQVKSTEPLQIDDDGNLITPDQWGQQDNEDIRYSPADELQKSLTGFNRLKHNIAKSALGSQNAYEKLLPGANLPSWIRPIAQPVVKALSTGNRTQNTQLGLERLQGALTRITKEVEFGRNRLYQSVRDSYGVKFQDLQKDQLSIINDALITTPAPLDNIQKAAIFAVEKEATRNAEIEYIDKVRGNMEADAYRKLKTKEERTQFKRNYLTKEQNEYMQRTAEKEGRKASKEATAEATRENADAASRRAATALSSLPVAVQDSIMDMRNTLTRVTAGAYRNGVMPQRIVVSTAGGRETIFPKSFMIEGDQFMADKIMKSPELMEPMVDYAEETYLSNYANDLIKEAQEAGSYLSRPDAIRKAAALMPAGYGENAIKAFLHASVSNPASAFDTLLAGRLKLTKQQIAEGLPDVLSTALTPYDDATINFANMALKIGDSVAKQQAFEGILRNALRTDSNPQGWILDTITDSPEFEGYVLVKEHAKDIPGFSTVFGDYYVPEAFIKEMKSSFDETTANGAVRWMLKLNTLAMRSATSLNLLKGPARNFVGSIPFLVSSGNVNPAKFKKASIASLNNLTKKSTPEMRDYLLRLTELGVLDDNPIAGMVNEMQRFAKNRSRAMDTIDVLTQGALGVRKNLDRLNDVYQMPDNFWKVVVFEQEMGVIKKAEPGIAQDLAEAKASERVKAAYPTMSRMNAFGRAFRKPGVQAALAPFIGFGAEVTRVMYANPMLAIKDLKSGNPVYQAAGARRLAGTVLAYAFFSGVGALLKSMFNVSDEEDEAARKTMSPYDQNAGIWYSRDADGKLKFFNTSFLNPFSQLSDPIRSAYRAYNNANGDTDNATVEGVKAFVMDTIGTYAGLQIGTQAAVEALTNTRIGSDGSRVNNPQDPDYVQKQIMHVLQGVIPFNQTAKNLGNVGLALTGTPNKQGTVPDVTSSLFNLTFARTGTVEPIKSFQFQAYRLNRELLDSGKLITGLAKSKGPVAQADISYAYDSANKSYRSNITRAHELYKAQLILGTNPSDARAALKEAGLSARTINMIVRGYAEPYRLSEATEREVSSERNLMIKNQIRLQPSRVFLNTD